MGDIALLATFYNAALFRIDYRQQALINSRWVGQKYRRIRGLACAANSTSCADPMSFPRKIIAFASLHGTSRDSVVPFGLRRRFAGTRSVGLETAMDKNQQSPPILAKQPKRLEKLASVSILKRCHRGQETAAKGNPPNIGIA
jgi:hypothetical protein